MKLVIIIVCVAFVVTLLYVGGAGLFGGRAPQVQAVARVNGDVIDAAQVQQVYAQTINLYRQFGQVPSQVQRHSMEFSALQQLVDYQLMLQAAKRDRIRVDEAEVNRALASIKEQYGTAFADALRAAGMTERDLRNALREQFLVENLRRERSTVMITDEELRRVYDESLEEIEVRHILIEPESVDGQLDWNGALREAEELLARIKTGEDFAELARQYSDDAGSSEDGGALGWIDRETPFVSEFLNAAFGLEVGEVSAPVMSIFGYHLIQVTDRRTREEAPFENVKETLRARLEAERGLTQFRQWLDEERAKATIEILDPEFRAYQLMLNNRIDQAIAQYREAIALSPLDPYLHYHLANALEQVEAHDEALQAYLQAAELSGYDPELWFALGQAYRRRGDAEAARDAYLKAAEYAPSNLSLLEALGIIFDDMGFAELAEEQRAKANEIRELLLEQERQRQEQLQRQAELLRLLEQAQNPNPDGGPASGESDQAGTGAETGELEGAPQGGGQGE